MPGPGRKLVVALTVVGLLAVSGVAMAIPTDSDDADTVFNVGYDADFHVLFWGTSPNDGSVDCELEDGAVTVDFGADGAVEAADFADCELQAGEVDGPNGQINHGMFMRLFNSLYEGKGRGCVIRYLAQLEFGKDDQQIKVSDVDPEFVSAAEGDTADVEFLTFLADCDKGKKSDDAETGDAETGPGSQGKGRPDSPGNSGNAPGHNKNQDS
jgi:hypothetical protein